MTTRPPCGDPASCSALSARMRVEAARLSQGIDELDAPGRGPDRTAPHAMRELRDVVADLELLADALQRHAMAQLESRRLSPERAASLEGRGRQALLRACRRVRRIT